MTRIMANDYYGSNAGTSTGLDPADMLKTRHMTRLDIPALLNMALKEGWISEAKEFHHFLDHNPRGCFVAEAGGEVVGSVMTYTHTKSAWIGNFIVKPGFRGRGVGTVLLERAICYLQKSAVEVIYLCAAPRAVSLYRRFQFRKICSIDRWSRNPAPVREAFDPEIRSAFYQYRIINDLDTYCWQDRRADLMEASWMDRECFYHGIYPGFIMAAHDYLQCRIGPWEVAEGNLMVAEGLLNTLLSLHGRSREIVCDVPEVNSKAAKLLKKKGFEMTQSTVLMALGKIPDLHLDEIFALASLGSLG